MTLPNFLIIGSQKGGTTWLHDMLRQHPEVYMPPYEVHYFNHPRNYAKGRRWYENHFRSATARHVAVGEKTPGYIRYAGDRQENTAERIHELIPDAKLIAVLRNPVDRLISAIHHHMVRGRLDPGRSADDILEEELRGQSRWLINHGYYYRGLAPFYARFSPDQILILIYERDVRNDDNKRDTAKRVCNFLRIDPEFVFVGMEKRANRSDNLSMRSLRIAHRLRVPPDTLLWRGFTVALDCLMTQPSLRPAPSESMRHRLYDLYAPENAKLFNLLGYEFSDWEHKAARSSGGAQPEKRPGSPSSRTRGATSVADSPDVL